VSCGYHDRFDPALLRRRPALVCALERLFLRLIPERTGSLLDLGCGTAYYWPILAERCERLIGVDLSPRMVTCGRRHQQRQGQIAAPTMMLCSAAREIPLVTGSIDTVLAVDALHHVDDLDAVLGEVRRLLRPGGRFVAVEPNVLNPVVFLAHLIPGEERGALSPNHPWALRRAIEAALGEVTVQPVSYVSGIESERALALVALLEPLFERPPLSAVALRKIYEARRR
jgi:SAM-dependent methyltransferase